MVSLTDFSVRLNEIFSCSVELDREEQEELNRIWELCDGEHLSTQSTEKVLRGYWLYQKYTEYCRKNAFDEAEEFLCQAAECCNLNAMIRFIVSAHLNFLEAEPQNRSDAFSALCEMIDDMKTAYPYVSIICQMVLYLNTPSLYLNQHQDRDNLVAVILNNFEYLVSQMQSSAEELSPLGKELTHVKILFKESAKSFVIKLILWCSKEPRRMRESIISKRFPENYFSNSFYESIRKHNESVKNSGPSL